MNSPSSVEALLFAVSGFLNDDLLATLKGADAFNVRVCLRAIGIAQREFKLKNALELAETKRLTALLKTNGSLEELRKALCSRIADDEFTENIPELHAHLWATIVGQLEIDQPTYSTYREVIRNLTAIP